MPKYRIAYQTIQRDVGGNEYTDYLVIALLKVIKHIRRGYSVELTNQHRIVLTKDQSWERF